jgi:hypothetical protein
VLALREQNPFPDKPPLYVRAQFYEYRYADAEERSKGMRRHRQLLGPYFPAVRLTNQ